jgi:hypothetical protein
MKDLGYDPKKVSISALKLGKLPNGNPFTVFYWGKMKKVLNVTSLEQALQVYGALTKAMSTAGTKYSSFGLDKDVREEWKKFGWDKFTAKQITDTLKDALVGKNDFLSISRDVSKVSRRTWENPWNEGGGSSGGGGHSFTVLDITDPESMKQLKLDK